MIASVILATALSAQPPPELANLRVLSQPGVNVVWEGVLLGEVEDTGALLVERIPPGAYTIVLRKPGFREQTLEVTVVGGRTTDLTATLARDVEQGAAVVESEKSPAPDPDPSRAGAREPSSEPGASDTPAAGEAAGEVVEVQEIEPESAVTEAGDAAVTLPAESGAGRKVSSAELPREERSSVSTAATSEGPDAGKTTRLLLILAVVAIVLAGVVFLALGRRRPPASPVAKPETIPVANPPDYEVKRVSSAATEPTFIEDLRRREKDMSTTRPRRSKVQREDVIDVEFSEIAESMEGD